MTHVSTDKARFNMIEQQIRPWGVLDYRALDIIAGTPREDFTPEAYRNLAFADMEIPLGHGAAMLEPKVEGRILQALDLREDDSVLEIGTGGGYLTACMARQAGHVTSVDIVVAFTDQARQRLADHGIDNVTLETGDASQGWNSDQRYDAIVISGSMPELPDSYRNQLKEGGRLFAVLGDAPAMQAVLIRRTGASEWSRETLFETELKRLDNCEQPPAFEF
jgi:protein-L-isoaspartate(D-aspartate) O-methyltransferase